MTKQKEIFFFMPLLSIGGTEMVHLDVIKALRVYPIKVFIRYSSNVWKGREYSQSAKAKQEGKAMLTEFKEFAPVTFLDRFLEAPRLGRMIKKIFIRFLAKKINRSENPIVIFWHRESIDFLIDKLEPHVKIIDIVHNNSNNDAADPVYLMNDWVPRIDKRVLISEGLMKWIEPLYKENGYSAVFKDRIIVIDHCVSFPSEGIITKHYDKMHVLFIGRDSNEKRYQYFLEIIHELIKDGLPLEIHIIGPDHADYPAVKSHQINWYGTISNRAVIEQIYRKAHVLVNTSSSEGFPKVIAEAMAFSCVPIATAVGDVPSQISMNQNGYLTSSTNCISETIAILKQLNSNPEELSRIAENCYLYAITKFSEERFKHEWKSVIESLS
jgi:glycosyltransferase involved in cell wall biosynthesis